MYPCVRRTVVPHVFKDFLLIFGSRKRVTNSDSQNIRKHCPFWKGAHHHSIWLACLHNCILTWEFWKQEELTKVFSQEDAFPSCHLI